MRDGKTKEKIIEVALSIMLSQGYSASSIDKICTAVGISKGSFFHYFKTKEELGLEVLEWYQQRAMKLVMSGNFVKEKDPMKRLDKFFNHVNSISKELWGEGCLLGSFATELVSVNKKIEKSVSEIFNNLAKSVSVLFEPVASGSKKNPSAFQLGEQFLMTIEGAIIMAKAHDDWKRVNTSIKIFRNYIELISK